MNLEMLIIGLMAISALMLGIFWVWSLVDCVTNKALDDGQRIAFILMIIFLGLIGSLVYHFAAPMRPIAIRYPRHS